jgi:hypothetical protein
VVAFTYPVGEGTVFYSTMPLDDYTGTSNAAVTQAEITTLFTNLQEVLCFDAGTLIETPHGTVPVETLGPGDHVRTLDGGSRPVLWRGESQVSGFNLLLSPRLWPIRLRKDALGPNCPAHDLVVSPQHRMMLGSKIVARMTGQERVLVAASKLTDLPGVQVIYPPAGVTYHHLLLDAHDIVIANGASSESLLTGPMALEAPSHHAREELFAKFPKRLHNAADPVLPIMQKSARISTLVRRHVSNAQPLIAPSLSGPVDREVQRAVHPLPRRASRAALSRAKSSPA